MQTVHYCSLILIKLECFFKFNKTSQIKFNKNHLSSSCVIYVQTDKSGEANGHIVETRVYEHDTQQYILTQL